MNKNFLRSLSALCLFFSCYSSAQWVEVTGEAVILESEETARVNALEDAVYQAMKHAGGEIATLPSLKPYFAEPKQQYRFSGNEIRNVTVLEQKKAGGKMYVTSRVDIYPSAKSCHKTQYKKGILLGSFSIAEPQQAAMGSVYKIGTDFASMLGKQIQKRSQSFIVTGKTTVPFSATQASAMTMLAEDHDAQYLIGGEITDLTATLDEKSRKKDQVNRQFAVSLEIMDGKTGEIIYQNSYREIGLWPFSRSSHVDTKSARFWVSPYGQSIQRISQNMMLDIESALSCRASLPEVINIHNNVAQMNVGRVHGVKQGDKLKLWHSAGFIDQKGIPRNRMVNTKISLTVDRVYEKSAELIVNQPELAASIQPGDLLTKQTRR
ncbi:flagellar basal-body protein [Photobacterium angustum]|uniref:flagellar assembly protein FlgT n=1 Tax=Photobacterium angustum TaxID=661 RepID=UPI0005DC61B2|nr:flagellar assembly protein FlgT [Photobacterium angustum]KJF96534.1 flagellar basal-body protein [Photobacterium angustum]KJG07410.1 flagellar basal-body protein [Photobacterium angustum]PSV96276.1 flagellar basal-body protein [Photobacterium angustum]PSW80613.1 flagellar basal-body protein [Photobacterium angustum]